MSKLKKHFKHFMYALLENPINSVHMYHCVNLNLQKLNILTYYTGNYFSLNVKQLNKHFYQLLFTVGKVSSLFCVALYLNLFIFYNAPSTIRKCSSAGKCIAQL